MCVCVCVKDAMLREYQDEIKRLKDQLDATQRGVIIGEDGKVKIGKEGNKCILYYQFYSLFTLIYIFCSYFLILYATELN